MSAPEARLVDVGGVPIALVPKELSEDVFVKPAVRDRDLSIDFLRVTLTLLVLAHHSCLAYTSWAHFDSDNVFRSTAPIVDTTRWALFDYAENFNDVFFMSLMFFISGLFVYPALRKHGTLPFIRDRFLRLGLPFVVAVLVLMPVAYYAPWQLSDRNLGFRDYYIRLARDGFTAGPAWFIWLLLFFDILFALLSALLKPFLYSVEDFMRRLGTHSTAVFVGVWALAVIAYIPLFSIYGFSTWSALFTSPFVFQITRIALYGLWFVSGVLVGIPGLSSGLLSRHGNLARHWPLWMAGCIVAYNALWFVPRLAFMHRISAHSQGIIEGLFWVTSCVASSFGFLALFRGVEIRSRSWIRSLIRSAYIMYLVHYVYLTWTQRLLLHRSIPAAIKFAFVFITTTLLSWFTAQCLLRIPKLRQIL